jgi:hypothetical protein
MWSPIAVQRNCNWKCGLSSFQYHFLWGTQSMKRLIKSVWLLMLAFCISATTAKAELVSVGGACGPWQWQYGGLNAAYAYGVNDQAGPTVVATIDGSALTAGQLVTVSYQLGTVSPAQGNFDADGDPSYYDPDSSPHGNGVFPSFYIPGSANYCELVGTFADAQGNIVGTPFALGNGPTDLTVPNGATRLQLGMNDNSYADNSGSWTISVTSADVPPVAYSGDFFLQPINSDGSSIFKQGSTVPVKFRLTGSSAGITDAVAKLTYAKVSNGIVGTAVEAVSTAAATTGNLFRYDSSSGQYIFNLSTKGLTAGTYQLKIDLGDGAEHTVIISLK